MGSEIEMIAREGEGQTLGPVHGGKKEFLVTNARSENLYKLPMSDLEQVEKASFQFRSCRKSGNHGRPGQGEGPAGSAKSKPLNARWTGGASTHS